MNSQDKIMKKLSFNVWAEKDERGGGRTEPAEISLIYGIGTDGLSDFERAVSDLNINEPIWVDIAPNGLRAYFGPLFRSLCRHLDFLESAAPCTLGVELLDCIAVEPKEIVTAIAELQKEGGCSSDCGCGCH